MRDLLITALAPILWGTTYLVTTEFLPPDRPLTAALLRALPVGILITLISGEYPRGKWWRRIFILGVLNIGVFFALLFVAAYRMPGGVVATVGALQPLLVMSIAWILLGEHPPMLAVGAGGVGILGVALLVLDPNAQLDPTGIVASIGATLSMAAGIVLTKRWGSPVGLLPFTAWQLVAGGLVLLPLALTVERPLPSLLAENMLGYLWLGLVNTGLAYWLWFRGIRRLRPFQISFLGLCSPVVAVILGYAFLSQTFEPRQLVGIGFILISILLAQYKRSQQHSDNSVSAPDASKALDLPVRDHADLHMTFNKEETDMAFLANLTDLRTGETGRIFEGYEFGDVNLSMFITDASPGSGPELHFHPYEEVFVILEGTATFTIADQTVVANSGDILLAPACAPHKFVNSGEGRLSTINIHPNARIIQEAAKRRRVDSIG